jgi:predicted nucleotide-binding protein (sugar kinase/HSP70/actin superfamily)
VTGKANDDSLDLYAFKMKSLLACAKDEGTGSRGTIGIPLCLNMYEMLPFWHAFWKTLGFRVKVSPVSSRSLYQAGQGTIPSDTACYPAKLSHGHIDALVKMGVDAIFYPCMSYNFDEGLGDNHYNCPVVAYYPEVLADNMKELESVRFMKDFINPADRAGFEKRYPDVIRGYYPKLEYEEIHAAIEAAYAAYDEHMKQIREEGGRIIKQARSEGRHIIVLAGRPYHVDPEVNHGIDRLITRLGAAVITEDSVSWKVEKFRTAVLNQWTYHSRLYAAAQYCTTQPDMDLVQLVSFGCGLDAITTDETREILQAGNRLYTQLKIDEITNLGTVNIRLRSLFAALEERKEEERQPWSI